MYVVTEIIPIIDEIVEAINSRPVNKNEKYQIPWAVLGWTIIGKTSVDVINGGLGTDDVTY